MSYKEITDRVNELSANWEQFKALNDRKDREVEKKGAADPVTLAQLDKISETIDGYQDNISALQTALNRPSLDSKSSTIMDSGKELEYKKSFCEYVRKGKEGNLFDLQKKTLSASQDRDGGYLVTHQMAQNMIKTLHDASPMRQIANVVQISSDALELIEDREDAAAGWTQELEARDNTATPQLAKKIIPVHELYAQPKATQKLIDDASIDIEAWLADKLNDVFSRKENAAFINGDGANKPMGLLSYASGKEWGKIEQVASQQDDAITAESLLNLFFSLKENYATNGKFLMSRSALQAIRTIKNPSTGTYLWQPSLSVGTPDSLLGAEVVQCADMPEIAKGKLAVAFGDFKSAYQIVDRFGIRLMRDPFTEKPFVKFYTTKRVGGDVVNFNAVKLLRIGK